MNLKVVYSVPNFHDSTLIAGNNFNAVKLDVVDDAVVALQLLQHDAVGQASKDQHLVATTGH